MCSCVYERVREGRRESKKLSEGGLEVDRKGMREREREKEKRQRERESSRGEGKLGRDFGFIHLDLKMIHFSHRCERSRQFGWRDVAARAFLRSES